MKAVVYHADAKIAERYPKDTYKNLLLGLRKNCNDFNIPLVHITINGFEGYGDENIYVDADPEDIVYNREKFFIEYLKSADSNETYYFTEPDSRINKKFPELTTDLAVLYRGQHPHITPAWRLAKKSALPIFEKVFSLYNEGKKNWDSDCTAWHKFYFLLDKSITTGITTYNNLSVELRDYKSYCMRRRSGYVSQFKSNHKSDLIKQDEI
jgi:hypothetical protein